jgi:putative NIF3 family GTP cyclohydrolase 1 type 2
MDSNIIRKILLEKTNRVGLPSQKEIADFLSKYYPEESKDDKLFHDNWGLFSTNPNGVVKRILLCTTPTSEIIKLAKAQQYDLVISHHDFLFNHPEVPQIIYHSSMDESDKGHNQYFLNKLGLKNKKQYHKVLVGGDLYKPLTLEQFKEHLIKRGFEINGLVWESPNADNQIQSVLYCSGMGGMLLSQNHIIDARKYAADVYVTGELTSDPSRIQPNPFKYIIELGHTSSEKPLFKWIKNMIKNRWENLEVDLADKEIDVWGSDNYKNRMEKNAQWEKEQEERMKMYRDHPNNNPKNYRYDTEWTSDDMDNFNDFNVMTGEPLIDELYHSGVPDDIINDVADYLQLYYDADPSEQPQIMEQLFIYLGDIDPEIENHVRQQIDYYFPDNPNTLSEDNRPDINEGLNIPKKMYIVKWLEFPTGQGPYGGGGWSSRAKHRPKPIVKSVQTSNVIFDKKSIYVNGIRKLKVNVYQLNGTPIREDYPNIKFQDNNLFEGLNLKKKDWEEITIPSDNWSGNERKIKISRSTNELYIENVGIFKLDFVDNEDPELIDIIGKSINVTLDHDEKTSIHGFEADGNYTFYSGDYDRTSNDPYVSLAKLIFLIY